MPGSTSFPARHWSSSPIARVLRPIQEFTERSASGGVVLMAAAVVALILANSPLAGPYERLLHVPLGISAGPLRLELSLAHWISDALMVVFFFVVGLEIKRELLVGELANLRAALLPIIGAVGGAAVPALIYVAFNAGTPGVAGWGIPMATDIAFAIGVLALLGSRVPFPLVVFVTAVAIIDDLIAVLVIAFFYSGGLDFTALGLGFAGLAVLVLGNALGIRTILFYLAIGILVWLAFLQSGVHATIAGVLVAWTVPARNRIDPDAFLARAGEALARFRAGRSEPTLMLTDEAQQAAVLELETVCENVQAPLQKLEHRLHGWVAFFVMPVFALANAGVALSLGALAGETSGVVLGIVLGLVVGKPIGLVGATWLAVRSGITQLPAGVRWAHMVGAGAVAGIGFTMSLFVGTLAFGEGELLEAAKVGIITASVIAGVLGYVLLSRTRPVAPAAGTAAADLPPLPRSA
jgi:NhaA family Na+:H+ antiporter